MYVIVCICCDRANAKQLKTASAFGLTTKCSIDAKISVTWAGTHTHTHTHPHAHTHTLTHTHNTHTHTHTDTRTTPWRDGNSRSAQCQLEQGQLGGSHN